MQFACLHIPDLMVQAMVRTEPDLRGCALALVDRTPPLWNVVAANKTAFMAGIELGMAKPQAEQFRGVAIRRRSPEQEKAAHAALLDLGWSFSPSLEDTSQDTILLDLSGLDSLFGPAEIIARQLAQHALGLGLTAHVAVASNPDAALHAARGFAEVTVIPAGEEARHLGGLPISVLSPATEALETLERWGIHTCQALAALPVLDLSERLGPEGVRLHRLARGASQRSLVRTEPSLCFEETFDLEYAVAELEPLAFLLGRLLNALCTRLAARSLAACAIRLRFGLAPGAYEKVLTLPLPLRDPKLLLNLLRLQVQADPPRAPILRISLAADPARPRVTQSGLFLPASPDPEKLELTMARLAHLVGNYHVGSPQLLATHRFGQFRMSRFHPVCGDADRRQKSRPTGKRPRTGFRIFRPPLPARVDLGEGRPVRVLFRGMSGDVLVASGPWRGSGDWWQEDAWEQEEWDLEIRFDSSGRKQKAGLHSRVLYRFYYDSACGSWFVRGAYD
jgi:protein ImuB